MTRHLNPVTRRTRLHGFSMIEVLVTLIIITIGLLGLAGMQAVALGNAGAARTNSVAAMLANSLAASISTNRSYWGGTNAGTPSGFTPPTTVTASGTSLTPTIASGTASCASQTCAANEMAAYDLKTWGAQLTQLLPDGKGEVRCTPNPNTVTDSQYLCVVTVSWIEKSAKSANSKHGAMTMPARQTYTLVVQQ